uniref:DUF4283 domain-containing protein n=1 Tax=Tanacetum cinerariifolium TaxID=118510 RepID=A0A6L2KMU4_TANCI|nr:hypothetical protein [Tanacetum cinerariifolium]
MRLFILGLSYIYCGGAITVAKPKSDLRRFGFIFLLLRLVLCEVLADGFLWVGRGVKEKQVSLTDKSGEGSKRVDEALAIVTGSVTESNGTLNDATSLVASVAKEVVSPSVDETVAKDKQTPTPTQETPSAGNAPGKSSYANVTGKPIGEKLNFRTLFTPGGNGIDLVVSVESIKAISEGFVNIACGFFLGKRFSFMEGLNAMLKNEDASTVSVWVKLHGVLVTTFSEDNLSAIATKLGNDTTHVIFVLSMSRNCLDVPIARFFAMISSVNKKKNVELTKEVSKSNPFEVLTSVENDTEFGTNGGTSYKASQETNSSGSSFCNMDASSPSTTPIIEKIDKIEKLIIEGKVTLVNNDGKSLANVASSCDYDSKDEVESVENDKLSFWLK